VHLRSRDRVLARHLTEGGLEVDAIEILEAPFSGVLVAQIQKVTPHPTLRHLAVYDLVAGTEQARVISGAPNLKMGMHVPWATIGARLTGLPAIGVRWFDGIGSQGMLCSESELTLGSRADRILELPDAFPVGSDLAQTLGWPDVLYDINVTPNRGDCLSALGLAREISALENEALKKAPALWSRDLPAGFPITLIAHEACTGVAILCVETFNNDIETPLWMKLRLKHVGIASVHPVVDVTQYVMMELGQPTHAYDLDRLAISQIEVRWAKTGESCVLLNNQEAALDESMLVISDSRSVIGIAGIMGGKASSVHSGSSRFMIESAHFTPSALAGRARRLGLATEAAARFERGVDPQLPPAALERIFILLSEIYGTGIRFLNTTWAGSFNAASPSILLPRSLCSAKLGIQMKTTTVQKKLAAVGCVIDNATDFMHVTPPSYRFDLTAPIDLVEEVARLVGYENFPERPLQGPIRIIPAAASRAPARQWALRLVCRGYQETIHMPFTSLALDSEFSWNEAAAVILQNPLAQDQSILRRSLWPSLIDTLRYNLAREQKRLRIFEIGPAFEQTDAQFNEKEIAAGLWHGLFRDEEWGLSSRTVDFFDVKADLESLLEPVRERLRFEPFDVPMLDPAETAVIILDGYHLGILGAVHPGLQKRWEMRGKTYLWSLNMIDLEHFSKVEYKPVARFPAVRRDFAFILPETVPFYDIHQALLESGQPLLKEIKLFDLYVGPPLDAGFRSLGFGLLFRDQDSTLTEKVVSELCERLVLIVEGRFRGKLRK